MSTRTYEPESVEMAVRIGCAVSVEDDHGPEYEAAVSLGALKAILSEEISRFFRSSPTIKGLPNMRLIT